MLKAMYGCIQASPLWYQLLKKLLEELGYKMSETDKCVFRKVAGDRIYILLVYVDDILALVDQDEAKKLRKLFDKRFGKVQFELGKKHSYLGMQICIAEEGIIVDMTFYAKKILECEDVQEMRSPATKLMFIVKENSRLLSEEDRKQFHAKTAKLLYLA
jgi:hypothetical protein